ncbi:unnamed protein product [Paramecium pentaurelia]|uniref:Uncharacterized protein n=1 Tax=Paramecium pentaurelia TaxID=43138 RepID=A0A8S1YPH6_9CILI|nr:unnamed protein product [Paramecium pentaurelia]
MESYKKPILKRQEKQEELNQQIAIMRKNNNLQLNEISEKLITEFSLPINKTGEICKFQQTSMKGLSQEELFSNISYLIQYDKENLGQDSKIESVKSKDSLFLIEIESRLGHLIYMINQTFKSQLIFYKIFKMIIKFKGLSYYHNNFKKTQKQIKSK